MQFIDKLNPANEKAGCDEIQSVIDSHWIEEESRYRNLDYNNAKSQLGKFTEIIVGEQHELCCYCMRRLYTDASQNGNHKSNITLEHIIPNKISESQWLKERDRDICGPRISPRAKLPCLQEASCQTTARKSRPCRTRISCHTTTSPHHAMGWY